MDVEGVQVVFCITRHQQEESPQYDNSIWYWKQGIPKAVMKVNNQSSVVAARLLLSGIVNFSDNGRYIQFGLEPVPDLRKPSSPTSVYGSILLNVWSTQDTLLQCLQANANPQLRTVIMNNETGQFTVLKDFEELRQVIGDIAVILKRNKTAYGDRFWETDYRMDSCWLLSLKNNTRDYLSSGEEFGSRFYFVSPSNNYVVYFDPVKCHYFSYNLRNGKRVRISAHVPDGKLGFRGFDRPTNEKSNYAAGIAGWIKDDKGLLVYDNFDIWLLDLTGRKRPINVTNGEGEISSTLFCLLNGDRGINGNQVFSANETLLLKTFNSKNKYSGY